MINKPPPFKGPNIRIPIIIPIKGRELINQGSTLGWKDGGQRCGFQRLQSIGKFEKRLRSMTIHLSHPYVVSIACVARFSEGYTGTTSSNKKRLKGLRTPQLTAWDVLFGYSYPKG